MRHSRYVWVIGLILIAFLEDDGLGKPSGRLDYLS